MTKDPDTMEALRSMTLKALLPHPMYGPHIKVHKFSTSSSRTAYVKGLNDAGGYIMYKLFN